MFSLSKIDEHLLDGERISYRAKLHWSSLVPPGLAGTAVAIGFLIIPLRHGWPLAVSFLSVATWFLFAFVRRFNSEFAVTNRRVVIHVGVVAAESFDIFLARVSGVEVQQSSLGRLLGYGSLQLVGTGGSVEHFRNVENPWRLRLEIESMCVQGKR